MAASSPPAVAVSGATPVKMPAGRSAVAAVVREQRGVQCHRGILAQQRASARFRRLPCSAVSRVIARDDREPVRRVERRAGERELARQELPRPRYPGTAAGSIAPLRSGKLK